MLLKIVLLVIMINLLEISKIQRQQYHLLITVLSLIAQSKIFFFYVFKLITPNIINLFNKILKYLMPMPYKLRKQSEDFFLF
jgi:hypothetical protein